MKKWITYLLLLTAGNAFAQEVVFSAVLDSSSGKMGYPFHVNLSMEIPMSKDISTLEWPKIELDDTVNGRFEVWESTAYTRETKTNDQGESYFYVSQDFDLATFDTGMVAIPPFSAKIENDIYESNFLMIHIPGVFADTTQPIKDIRTVASNPLSLWEKIKLWGYQNRWVLIAFAVLILGIVVFFWIKKRKPVEEKIIVEEVDVRYLRELRDIFERKPWRKGHYKAYHTELTNVIRGYISERYSVAAMEKTSDEIVSSLKFEILEDATANKLTRLLNVSDLVKFAKETPTADENERLLGVARDFIIETTKTKGGRNA